MRGINTGQMVICPMAQTPDGLATSFVDGYHFWCGQCGAHDHAFAPRFAPGAAGSRGYAVWDRVVGNWVPGHPVTADKAREIADRLNRL